jgi:Protein of unknown function (DUF3073)
MGRGRAKAKQTKVARDLKYNSGGFDLDRLRADIGSADPTPAAPAVDELDDEDDPYADYDADEDDDADEAVRS